MDERHWWLTSKILQTFQTSIFVNPTLVEDFMTDSSTLGVLNQFFQQEGGPILFFYAVKDVLEDSNGNSLELKLSTLASNDLGVIPTIDNILGIYFVKKRREEITVNNIELEVLSGEIKQSLTSSYGNLVCNAMCPMVLSKADWGKVTVEDAIIYLNEVDRCAEMLVEFSNGAEIAEQILSIPDERSIGDFRKNRQFALNPLIISEYESFVSDWIQSIEMVLLDSMDER